jgi:hypothetical protein
MIQQTLGLQSGYDAGASSIAPLSHILVCPGCGQKRVLPVGVLPIDGDLGRRPMRGHPWFMTKTYEDWYLLEHKGCMG